MHVIQKEDSGFLGRTLVLRPKTWQTMLEALCTQEKSFSRRRRPYQERHMVISQAQGRRGNQPYTQPFSMQKRWFSSTLGGPRTGGSALQGSRAASPRASSPRGYTTTRAHFRVAQPSLKQSGQSTTNMSSRQPSMVGIGDVSSTGLPRDKPSRRPKSSQTPVPPNKSWHAE